MTNNSLMTGISRVDVIENNISQAPIPSSTSRAAIAVWAKKGEINKPILITGGENQIISTFGMPHPSYGFGLYGAIKFANTSASIYIIRAVAGSYSYASTVFGENYVSSVYNSSNFGVPVYTDAKVPDTSITWNIGSTRQNAFLVRRIGPGSEGNSIAVSISSQNMPASSTALTATAGTESGSVLASGAYRWKAVPTNNLGRALDSVLPNTTDTTITNPTTNLATVVFPRITGATGYEIYRNFNNGGYQYYAFVPQVAVGLSTVQFVDRGQFVQDTARPLPASPAGNYTPTPIFTLNVFDTLVSSQNPIETFDVTFNQSISGMSQQQGIEEKVNLLSKNIRVKRNDQFAASTPNLYLGSPIFYSSALAQFTLGLDGLDASSIPDSAYINAYNLVANSEKYEIRMLIEAGKTLAVQNALIDLAANRKDCIPFLDVPPDYQEASNAVNYRRNILNKNTDRGALYCGDLKVYDKYNSLNVWVPPSAHAAAIFAAVDAAYNVYTAGAGLLYAQLNDVQEVRYTYNLEELGMLANSQINPIRSKSSMGTWLPEQLTLAAILSAMSFISVRRMIDAIEIAVTNAFDYSLQQPNDDFLARQLINLVSSFLEPIKNGRGIEQYEIVSDATNNTPAYTNNAQRNISIYIWPILPARYIQLMMNITKAGVEFQELIVNQ